MRNSREKTVLQSKIKEPAELAEIIAAQKSAGKKVVFTNGCFDILHYGHAMYLQDAASHGDVLVVGINSDASVRRIKGERRPVVGQEYRIAMVAALESVDYAVLFDQDTPLSLIKTLVPDVLVKGGDWKKEDIVGADFVESRGGKVLPIKFVEGFSTTSIINKIAQG